MNANGWLQIAIKFNVRKRCLFGVVIVLVPPYNGVSIYGLHSSIIECLPRERETVRTVDEMRSHPSPECGVGWSGSDVSVCLSAYTRQRSDGKR